MTSHKDTNTLNPVTNKTIKHGPWEFEYNFKQNVFRSDLESFEDGIFRHHLADHQIPDLANGTLTHNDLEDFRRAALIHKIARKKALSMMKTGALIAELVDAVEETILRLCKQNPSTYYLKGSTTNNNTGIAFPVGVNINNVIAHDSKVVNHNSGYASSVDQRIFFKGDVVKVDIGVHVNGRIIDSAFTHIITDLPGISDTENIYNTVLEASRDSMFSAIKLAGPDQSLYEMSQCIDEIIRSYEVNMGGDVLPIKPVKGIGGHDIKQYQIHGNKLILSEPDYKIQGDSRMEEDEVYAIETYTTTGMGFMTQNTEMNQCTHFMETSRNDILNNKAITKKDKKRFRETDMYNWMQTRQGLPFSFSWIDPKTTQRVDKSFNLGISSGQMMAYPPLFDENNSVVAQFEHTIHVKPTTIEVFSLGEDY